MINGKSEEDKSSEENKGGRRKSCPNSKKFSNNKSVPFQLGKRGRKMSVRE